MNTELFSQEKAEQLINDKEYSSLFAYVSSFPDDPSALCWLGYCHMRGLGTEYAPERAADLYLTSASLGNISAKTRLGLCYESGVGVPRDPEHAVMLYQETAAVGYSLAMSRLGSCYETGSGIARDVDQAIWWFRKAALRGSRSAMASLGQCYLYGLGTQADPEDGVLWLTKAAELGSSAAMNILGCCYENGAGTVVDLKEAAAWFRRGADLQYGPAVYNLGRCYMYGLGVEESVTEAIRLYRASVLLGNRFACGALGQCYAEGIGVEPDMEKAVQFYRQATDNPDAMYRLGLCLWNGTGTAQDREEALTYIQLASNMGYSPASQFLLLSQAPQPDDLSSDPAPISAEDTPAGMCEPMVPTFSGDLDDMYAQLAETTALIRQLKEMLGEQTTRQEQYHQESLQRQDLILQKQDDQTAQLSAIHQDTSQLLDLLRSSILPKVEQMKSQLQKGTENMDEQTADESITAAFQSASEDLCQTLRDTPKGLEEARCRLKKTLGQSTWDCLLDDTRNALASANVLWEYLSDMPNDTDFDYSCICILTTSALEGELNRYFLVDFQNFLEKKYGPGISEDGKKNPAWPESALGCNKTKTRYWKKESLTLGDLCRNFLQQTYRDPLMGERMREYLPHILNGDASKSSDPVAPFFQPKNGKDFVTRCNDVRVNYRNPAAHTAPLTRDKAEGCYTEVVGKLDALQQSTEGKGEPDTSQQNTKGMSKPEALRQSADAISLLIELTSLVKPYTA